MSTNKSNPPANDQTLQRGIEFHNQGRLSEAESIYRDILKQNPNQPQAMHYLGVIAHQMGRSDIAADLISKAIAIKPDYGEAHSNLGLAYRTLEKHSDALSAFQKAAEIEPELASAHNNLGLVLYEMNRAEESLKCFQAALQLRPDFIEALTNLGNAERDLQQDAAAIVTYQKALALNPEFAGAHYNLGVAYQMAKNFEAAEISFETAISLEPNIAEAHHGLGMVLKEMNRINEAEESFKKALTLQPDFAEAHFDLGVTFKSQGQTEAATQHFERALALKPEKVDWLITKELMLPVIPKSIEGIKQSRTAFMQGINKIANSGLTLEDPLQSDIESTPFYLSYHNIDNREIMTALAKMYIGLCPKLIFEANHCTAGNHAKHEKIRIGFLSSFFRDHTISKLNRGFIENFSREKFDVIVFHPPGKTDHMSETVFNAADKVVPLISQLEKDQKTIAEEELDILFYPDIGMNPHSYFMAFARLAPIQAMTWGHPDTTGIPNMDYFISSEHIEDATSAAQYSEQLVQLKKLTTHFYRPQLPDTTYDRADFNLPEDKHLYMCPQSLFKFHPDFDAIFADILKRDPDGVLVLIDAAKGNNWKAGLLKRLSQSHPDIIEQILFVPPMPTEKFFGLINLADALLDIPTFSGGNTTLEAFALKKPIVTYPQSHLRARLTAGFYKQMGVTDLIVDNAEAYVELALRLAQEPEFNQRMQAEIETNADKVFEDTEVVRELETFFEEAYKKQIS